MQCKDCFNLIRIQNTDECRQAICSVGNNWQPVNIDNECLYAPKQYTCKDCDHFDNDYACMTAEPDDDASSCAGFYPKEYNTLFKIAINFMQHGLNVEKEFMNAYKEAKQFYEQIPHDLEN